jgi:5-hydroxyisourate hydrolase-like protein (transthyretin family)
MEYPLTSIFMFETSIETNCTNTKISYVNLIGLSGASINLNLKNSKAIIEIEWKTKRTDSGFHIFCLSATDTNFLVAIKCQRIYFYADENVPRYISNTAYPHNLITYESLINGYIEWSVMYDTYIMLSNSIEKPPTIEIFKSTGELYLTINQTNITTNGRNLTFRTTNEFTNGLYFISFRTGIIVNQLNSSIKGVGIVKKNEWIFSYDLSALSPSFKLDSCTPNGFLNYSYLTELPDDMITWSINATRNISYLDSTLIKIYHENLLEPETNYTIFNVSVDGNVVQFNTSNKLGDGSYVILIEEGFAQDALVPFLKTKAFNGTYWSFYWRFSINNTQYRPKFDIDTLSVIYTNESENLYEWSIKANSILKKSHISSFIFLQSLDGTTNETIDAISQHVVILNDTVYFYFMANLTNGSYNLTFEDGVALNNEFDILRTSPFRNQIEIKIDSIDDIQVERRNMKIEPVVSYLLSTSRKYLEISHRARVIQKTTSVGSTDISSDCKPIVNILNKDRNTITKRTESLMLVAEVRLTVDKEFENRKWWVIWNISASPRTRVIVNNNPSINTKKLIIPPNYLQTGYYQVVFTVEMSFNSSCQNRDFVFVNVSYPTKRILKAFQNDSTNFKVLLSQSLLFNPYIYDYDSNGNFLVDEIKYYCRLLDEYTEYPKNDSFFLLYLKNATTKMITTAVSSLPISGSNYFTTRMCFDNFSMYLFKFS